MTVGRIAILTSGGDAPGMNASIRAATLLGIAHGAEVIGIERGYAGLLDGAFTPLTADDVHGILREGGTILGTARCKDFHQPAVRDAARRILHERGITGLLVVGGNGSLTGALALTDPAEAPPDGAIPPPRVVGVPASIDNDIGLTGLAIGVDTAMNTIVEACDKIADTATAHDRTFLVEVMGRDCGYLAMTSAIAAGADLVLFPEAHRDEAQVVEAVVKTVLAARHRARRHRRVIVIKAEGVQVPIERLKQQVDARLQAEIGGEPSSIETRVTVLGHVVRGGRPSAFDRLLGSRLANVAMRSLFAGKTARMAAWMPPVELDEDVGQRSEADPYCWLVDLGAVITETENLLAGRSPLARWRAGVFDELEDVLTL